MQIRHSSIPQFLWIVTAIIAAFTATGCSSTKEIDEVGSEQQNVQLLIAVHPDASDPETAITSLRMLVFNAGDNSLVLNASFNPDEVYHSAQDSYLLSGQIKNTNAVRIFIIANERPAWQLESGVSYASIATLTADYYDPAQQLSNVTAPFLMLGFNGEEIQTPPDSKIERNLSLVRNVVKVTLKLRQKLVVTNGVAQALLTFKTAAIDRVPKHGFLLTDSTYETAAGYTKSSERDLAAIGSELSNDYSTLKESVEFYIPEHLLTDKTKYTRLLITATDNSGSRQEVTYEIPLGNGVQKYYNPTAPIAFDDLTTTDLSARRNTHFVIDAIVSLSDINASFKVKEWVEKEIPGDITYPYLNISSLNDSIIITKVVEDGVEKLVCNPETAVFYVWTNLGKESLVLNPTVIKDSEAAVPLGDLFDYTWTVTEAEAGFLPNVLTATGRLEIRLKDPSTAKTTYTMNVSAKNLNRNFRISTRF